MLQAAQTKVTRALGSTESDPEIGIAHIFGSSSDIVSSGLAFELIIAAPNPNAYRDRTAVRSMP